MGDYVDIGPVHMYYEVYGEGDPLVLLHGGLDTNAAWGSQVDALAKHYRVFAPERRGQGHTPDVDGPITYQAMAHDLVGFLDTVVGGPAHLVGWSDGAVVAVLVALSRPDLVRKLVLIGGNVDVSAYVLKFEEAAKLPAEDDLWEPFRAVYAVVSPDGAEHWPVVHGKITRLWREEPHIAFTDLDKISARTLVLVGDDDLVTLEHTIAIYRAVPDAELAVVPGTSHLAPLERPDLVNHLLLDFLNLDPVPTLMPVRRAPEPAPA